jgi:electron transfer flavoprotein beta subunit
MKITVILTMVPDLVEELEIDSSGTALDTQWLRYVLSESDDHALEQALVLKDRHGGTVTVLALDEGDADQTLFTALAKGADAACKVTALPGTSLSRRHAAAIYAEVLRAQSNDLVLTGVQAISDLDGHLPGLLGGLLKLPYVGVTRAVELTGSDAVVVHKEYPGGTTAEIEVRLPAVVGVLSAPQPPRYVPVARIREVTKTKTITAIEAPAVAAPAALAVRRMFKPEHGTHAQMLEGTPNAAVAELIGILESRGVLR